MIYKFYSGRNHRFELLAAEVIEYIIKEAGGKYKSGWLTPPAGDQGTDFVGRLDIGSGFSKTKVVLLGQAKCEKLDSPTGGNHIARTVARLKRGLIGAYVTTSYFSQNVQEEIIEDQYPIILVNGLILAKTVSEMMIKRGFSKVEDMLSELDKSYSENISSRRPEEILFE